MNINNEFDELDVIESHEEKKRAKAMGLTTKEMRKQVAMGIVSGPEKQDEHCGCKWGCDKCTKSESGWARDCRIEAEEAEYEKHLVALDQDEVEVERANPGWISQDDRETLSSIPSRQEKMEQARLERMARKTAFTPLQAGLDLGVEGDKSKITLATKPIQREIPPHSLLKTTFTHDPEPILSLTTFVSVNGESDV